MDPLPITFAPRSNAHMNLPTVKEHCLEKRAFDFSDQTGALKLWPGELLQPLCTLSAEAMLARAPGRYLVLVLTADTAPYNP